jgi:acyl-CoA synthetase (NDP forming)
MDRLQRLFHPKSIAVVGGGAWCEQVSLQCQKMGFAGVIHAVHPTKNDIAGIAPLRRVDDLLTPPDAVFLGVNRHATIDVVAQLAQMGAGGAVCFASGFREAAHEMADGDDLQTALLAAAGDMPVLGPNCYGFLNYLDGVALWPDQHGGNRVDGGVALVMQSSNVAINMTMQMRGLPVAFVVTVGNQAQAGLSEIGKALLANPKVTALGLYVDGIAALAAFVDLARAAQAIGKPIVALKIGRSAQAQKAAVSHTASIAGSDAGADALLARLGIGRVTSLSALLETLKLLHVVGPLRSARVASLSCSGGEASLMADTAMGRAVSFPPLTSAQEDMLRRVLGPLVALSNPLDYHTFIWGDEDAMTTTYAAMMRDDIALGIVVLDFPRPDKCTSPDWDLALNAVCRAQAQTGRPIAVLSSVVETMPEAVAQRLLGKGILPMCGMPETLEAISVAAGLGERFGSDPRVHIPPDITAGSVLSEAASKAALATHGVQIPQSRRAALKDLATVARDLTYPLVLKGEGIAHKTEAGAVTVGLPDEATLLDAARAMPTTRFLVEEMIADTVAELLVGIVRDPAHGYVLTLAAGGILTELLVDSINMTVPVDRDQVRAGLSKLRIARVLQGYRGRPAANIDTIIDAVIAVQSYVMAEAPFEVEINPLLCGPTHAIAVDALITTGDAQ